MSEKDILFKKTITPRGKISHSSWREYTCEKKYLHA